MLFGRFYVQVKRIGAVVGGVWIFSNGQGLCSDEDNNFTFFPFVIIGSGKGSQALRKELDGKKVFHLDPFLYPQQKILSIDFHQKSLKLQNGATILFDKCAMDLPALPILMDAKFLSQKLLEQSQKEDLFLDISREDHIQTALSMIRAGQHITLIGGNSWEVISLAALLAKEGRAVGNDQAVTLLFPSFGPLSAIFPRLLSKYFQKRLQAVGVEVIPYSNIRYISESQSNDRDRMVYLAKTYDSLDTTTITTQGIAFGPQPFTSQYQYQAVALLQNQSKEQQRLTPSFQNYQFLLSQPEVEVHPFMGGIIVNRSLEIMKDIAILGPLANHLVTLGNDSNSNSNSNSRQQRVNCLSCSHYHQQMGAFLGQLWKAETTGPRGENGSKQRRVNRSFTSLPVEYMTSPKLELSVIRVGHCSNHLDGHSYTIKNSSHSNINTNAGDGLSIKKSKSKSLLSNLTVTFYVQSERIVGILMTGKSSPTMMTREFPLTAAESVNLEALWKQFIGKDLNSFSSNSNMNNTNNNSIMSNDPLSIRNQRIQTLETMSQSLVTSLLSHDHGRQKVLTLFDLSIISSSSSSSIQMSYKFHPASKLSYYDFQERIMKDYFGREGGSSASHQEPLFHTTNRLGSKLDQLQAAYARGITQDRYRYEYSHQSREGRSSESSNESSSTMSYQPPLTRLER